MAEVVIGTCGYGYYNPPDGWEEKYESKLAAYADSFAAVELNKPFYRLPQVLTAERWRSEARDDFTFTLKAWQAITHPSSSPTWNNHRDSLPESDEELGYFRPTQPVFDAWEATRKRAEALDAQVCLFQTPPSFDYSTTHEENMHEFLHSIERGELQLAWEPRGDWDDHPDAIADICTTHDVIHTVDIFRTAPLHTPNDAYIRLHGRNEQLHNYDYDYSNAELEELASRIATLASNCAHIYVMFNNYQMYENALRLAEKVTPHH